MTSRRFSAAPSVGARFWDLRARLWPANLTRRAGLNKPAGNPARSIDNAVEVLLDLREKAALGPGQSWACLPRHAFLRGFAGGDFSPYREVRGFWLPIAMAFADREHVMQLKRIDALRNQSGMARGLIDLEKAIERCATDGSFELFSAWRRSPFKPVFSNAYTLLVKLEGVGDAIRDFTRQFRSGRTGLEPHRNTIVWPHAFVAVLGIALRRLTGSDPTPARLQSLVDECCTALPDLLNRPQLATAVPHVCTEQADDWAPFTDLSAFLVALKQTWADIVETAPLTDGHKAGILLALHNDEIIPEGMREFIFGDRVVGPLTGDWL